MANVHPLLSQYFWYPILTQSSKPALYTPVWSLHIEAWAMLFMPFIVWVASGKLPRIALGFVIIGLASLFYGKFAFGHFFLLGAVAAGWSFRNKFLESAVPQWIGKVSYSLYLTHLFVFEIGQSRFGLPGLAAALPVTFPVAWIVWRYVETPSIELSRAVARRAQRALDYAKPAPPRLDAVIPATPAYSPET
jgi:peptidoglycan/LPS O-acetylase OafA/YrhL